MTTLGPNDLEPCGSDTALRRHFALGEHCDVCGVEGRRMRRMSLAEVVEFRRRQRELRAAWDGAA
jgi:hypothetical protein